MNDILTWVLPPLVGAVIGYSTNALAIKMIFRPYTHKKLFGKIPVPFTPGILPKQRYELSRNIADLVSEELLSADIISARLSTSETEAALANLLMDNFSENLPFRFEHICNAMARKILAYASGKVPVILNTLDIPKTVTERIDSLDMAAIERMVLDVTKSQLWWINVFGGILGAIIGIIQALLNNLIL